MSDPVQAVLKLFKISGKEVWVVGQIPGSSFILEFQHLAKVSVVMFSRKRGSYRM